MNWEHYEATRADILTKKCTHMSPEFVKNVFEWIIVMGSNSTPPFAAVEHYEANRCADGNGAAGVEGWNLHPVPHGFFLLHFRPVLHDGKNYLSHPCPLRSHEAPPYTVKFYFLLIFPITITIFSNKMTCFNNKIILEIINKFILSN